MVYSKQEDGSFYLPCVLFTSVRYHGSSQSVLVSRPLTVFKKALEMLRKHTDKEHHKSAVVQGGEFQRSISAWSTAQLSVVVEQISLADRISNNRPKLESIIKMIVLCGRQNIALCGHWDSALDIERDVAIMDIIMETL